MTHVFVWTLHDVIGLVMLGLLLLCGLVAVIISWLNDREYKRKRSKK